jgi:hypothetical protein
MGMELIVNVAVQNHPERDASDLLEILKHMTTAQANDIFEAVLGASYEEVYQLDDNGDTLLHVKSWISDFINAVYGSMWSRSIVVVQHPDLDKVIAIGGGDSYGDTPDGLEAVGAVAEWGEW